LRGLLLSEGRVGEEKGKEEKVKGREGEMVHGGGRDLAHPKILAWRPLRKTVSWMGEGKGGERNGKGRRGAESRERGRKESWNRAADWLRLALCGLL